MKFKCILLLYFCFSPFFRYYFLKIEETDGRTCLDSDFACSRNLCIPKAWVCDDSPDCPDARDEADCHSKSSLKADAVSHAYTQSITKYTCYT